MGVAQAGGFGHDVDVPTQTTTTAAQIAPNTRVVMHGRIVTVRRAKRCPHFGDMWLDIEDRYGCTSCGKFDPATVLVLA